MGDKLKSRPVVSVAMATYNGEKYVRDQIDSILFNLQDNDELVISDDGSTDQTISIIKSYKDPRIKFFDGPHKGIVKNFENALRKCNGDIIFLSDQDDVWLSKKVDVVLEHLSKNNCSCVVHNAFVMDEALKTNLYESYFDFRKPLSSKVGNIIKPAYLGCCMAFKAEMLGFILPIPENIEMHDRWIGTICNKYGNVDFIEDKLIKYRRHNSNASKMKRNGVIKIANNRMRLLRSVGKRAKDVRR